MHSEQYNTHEASFNTRHIKELLVNATLKHVKFDGFCDESLHMGARDIGISIANANALFPNSKKDVIAYWFQMLDDESRSYGQNLDTNMRIRDKISTMVKHRITCLKPHKVCLKMVIGHSAMPANITTALHGLYDSAGTMWEAIGDTTPPSDRNHYTKRLILATVLICSISFYLQDDSNEIDAYIDNRINDALKLGKIKSIQSLQDLTQYLPYMNHPLKMRD